METLRGLYQIFDSILPDENGCLNFPSLSDKPRRNRYVWKVISGEPRVWVHRAALERKLGRPIRPGFYALHSCDNRICVNPDHIYEGTYRDNANDRSARNHESYLTGDDHWTRIHPEWNIHERDQNGRFKKTA